MAARPGSTAEAARARRPAGPSDTDLVEIRLRRTSLTGWPQELADRWGARVHLYVCRPIGNRSRRMLRLLEVTADAAVMGEVWNHLQTTLGAEHVSVTRLAPHRLLVWTSSPMPALCSAVFEVGGVCTVCPFLPPASEDGREEWGVLIPHASDAQLPLQALTQPGGAPPAVLRVGRFHAIRGLTPRQELALEVAHSLGYFDHPRRAELEDVARALGVGRSTALEILRRAMHHLLSERRREIIPASGVPMADGPVRGRAPSEAPPPVAEAPPPRPPARGGASG